MNFSLDFFQGFTKGEIALIHFDCGIFQDYIDDKWLFILSIGLLGVGASLSISTKNNIRSFK